MNVYFNPKGVGNVLMISIDEDDRANIKHEKFGDITKITNKDGHVLGYNIFQASTHFDLSVVGNITMSEELLSDVKKLFEKEKLPDSLDVDLSPKFVVGYVMNKAEHENADKLSVCQVDVGEEVLQIVCGAANVDANQKVVVAKVGATMPSGLNIKPTKLRGVSSNGMICSREEIGLPNKENEKGIYILDDSHSIGDPFIPN